MAGRGLGPGAEGDAELPTTDFTTALMKMLAALALVLAVVVGLYWLSRRLMPGKVAGAGSGMRVLGRLGLGGRKSVVMVEAAGKVLVLGVAGDRVNLLCEVDDPEEISELTRAKGLGFAKILQKAKGEEK